MMCGRRAFSRVFEITESSEIGRKDVGFEPSTSVSKTDILANRLIFWDRVACGITGKRTVVARWLLAAHLGEGKL